MPVDEEPADGHDAGDRQHEDEEYGREAPDGSTAVAAQRRGSDDSEEDRNDHGADEDAVGAQRQAEEFIHARIVRREADDPDRPTGRTPHPLPLLQEEGALIPGDARPPEERGGVRGP
ncbi:hypothetical protein AXF14_02655 [Actinomyces radicidentis]|uniref:Uncharacterized protein n=1 Tax=Actinomyces radicidentis TaxID=111015 RepID=A0A109W266_ACTRD|nr:hypothetical protein AXF14_02655 [Actinomyces radicidentis]